MIVGIDPGLNGGITVLSKKGKLMGSYVMPIVVYKKKKDLDINALCRLFLIINPEVVVIEKQQAMPGQGVSSMFKIGKGYGILLGLCAGLKINTELVSPKAWQKVMFAGHTVTNTKETSREVAKDIFNVEFLKTDRCSIPHDGMTDSALIAEWYRRGG